MSISELVMGLYTIALLFEREPSCIRRGPGSKKVLVFDAFDIVEVETIEFVTVVKPDAAGYFLSVILALSTSNLLFSSFFLLMYPKTSVESWKHRGIRSHRTSVNEL